MFRSEVTCITVELSVNFCSQIVSKMKINLINLYKLCQDRESLRERLQEWGLIPQDPYPCWKCGYPLSLAKDEDRFENF